MPRSAASAAVSRGDVNISSFAFASPTSLGRNHDVPKSPLAPTLANAVTSTARSAAIRRSAASAIDSPAPAAAPGSAATTGIGSRRNARLTAAWWDRRTPTLSSSEVGTTPSAEPLAVLFSCMPFTSPPAQNAPPSPVSSNTRTDGSRSICGSTRSNAPYIGADSALRRSGRLNDSTATCPSMRPSRSSVPVSIFTGGPLSARAHPLDERTPPSRFARARAGHGVEGLDRSENRRATCSSNPDRRGRPA